MKNAAIYLLLLTGLTNHAFGQAPSEDKASIPEQEALSRAIAITEDIATEKSTAGEQSGAALDGTIETLQALTSLKGDLQADISQLHLQQEVAKSKGETQDIALRLEKLREDLRATTTNIQNIAAGADISTLRSKEQPAFNFQEELFSLLEPAMKEMKDMTSHVRQKTEQRDRIAYYSGKLPTAEQAVDNIRTLLERTEDPALDSTLQAMMDAWIKQRTFLSSEIKAASFQLEKLEQSETSLSESSQSYLKSFFQKRGLYLARAAGVVVLILLLSRLLRRFMERHIKGYQKEHRSFQIRLLDLTHRILTGLLVIVGPMIVFYLAEDWLLFSLGIIVLLVISLTLRHALPRYWQLAQLFLNVGTVREGERVEIDGLPWLVQKINFYTLLQNPTAKLTRRVKIDDLVDMRSRSTQEHEAWFPCRPGDWLLFDDSSLGKVISISEELTELVLRGGAHKTYTTAAFLDEAPVCLSQNFRIRETIGVSYSLQAEAVSTMSGVLHEHVSKRIEEEGYGNYLMNLAVEFEYANASSLDFAVIADYNGELAHAHNRLRRAMQRWCVEACTEQGWEIPFTQVTLHQAS